MRNRNLIAVLVAVGVTGGVAGISLARPGDTTTKSPDRKSDERRARSSPEGSAENDQKSMNVTVTAGRGRIGISVLQISDSLRTHLGAPADRGVMIDSVRSNSPGATAGLEVGDVIVDIDGKSVTAATDLLTAMSSRNKGDSVTVGVIRDHKRTGVKVTLDDDPGPAWQSQQMWNGNPDELMKGFGSFSADPMLRHELDAANRKIQQLERRIERLERGKT
jgi:membrane-associated protease RseP (regulator of RpoE activity)